MSNKDIEGEDLREKNAKLKAQFSSLLESYAKLELTDLRRNQLAENQKRLIDFIQRIAQRLDDNDLMDVLVDEFVVELGADRVSYILPGNGPRRRLAVSNEAVDKGESHLPIPYFISEDSDPEYIDMVYKCIDEEQLVVSKYSSPIQIHTDTSFQVPMEQNFQYALEEEFGLVSKVECQVVMMYPIKISGGDSVISLQRTKSNRSFSEPQKELFKDMCRYAGMLLEQTQMTQEIRDLKDQLSSLIQSMPSAIIGMDLLGTITMWGGRAEDMFGISEDEALGRVFWEMVPEYVFVSNALMDVLRYDSGQGVDFSKVTYRTPEGDLVYHQVNLFTMFGSNRGEVALRIDDITKQEELNQQLLHAQRMETVGTIAGGLAHDFNNVLGGLVGTLSLMKQRLLKRKAQNPTDNHLVFDLEDIEIMESCTTRATDMVKRLLSLSRKTKVEMEPLDLCEITKNIHTLCNASFESRIKIEGFYPAGKLWIEGNKTQLEQVILNLCVNARDAMKKGGVLSLDLSLSPLKPEFKQKHQSIHHDKMVTLRIKDSGEGIPKKDLDRIFDPFYTTKEDEQGTGLGLSIVDKIVKEHNGFLEVESSLNQGTVFTLYFYPTAPGKTAEVREQGNLEMGAGDVLVVDDDEIIRKTISRILYSMGYSVSTASSGATALGMIESGLNYHLVILDVDMPVMSGLDTFRLIRKKHAHIPILFCTGRHHQYQMQDVLGEENTWMITKPFSLEELNRMVKTCFEGKKLKY